MSTTFGGTTARSLFDGAPVVRRDDIRVEGRIGTGHRRRDGDSRRIGEAA
jgi:hypothetical protein